MSLPPLTFLLGGARSGKSRRAQSLAEEAGPSRVYVATATAEDAEMAKRIARHRADRGDGWRTVEAPLDLPEALAALPKADACVIDCLTLWVSNLLHADRDPVAAGEALLAALPAVRMPAILVSNEVGLGIVPDNPLARRFRDEIGRLHQNVATAADRVLFMAAGLSLQLKP